MRILFTFEFPFVPEHYGGGHQIARGFARALARAGHDVHVLANGADEMGLAAHDAGVRWHFTGRYATPWGGVQVGRRAPALLDALRPDLVCTYTSETPLVLRAARRRGIPAAVYLAAPELLPFREPGIPALRLVRHNFGLFLLALGSRGAARVLTISRTIAEQAVARWGVPPAAVRAVGTGLDEAYEVPLAAPRPAPGAAGPRVLSFGRITLDQKPVDRLARALALPGAPWREWTHVGGGPDEERLRRTVAELGLAERARLVGMRPPGEVVRLIDEHDVVVLPSRSESFFIAAYEAAARGRPLVTNDVAEVAQYFAGEPSVVVLPDDDPAGYRRALDEAGRDFAARQRGARALAERVRAEFGWDGVAARLVAATRDLAGGAA